VSVSEVVPQERVSCSMVFRSEVSVVCRASRSRLSRKCSVPSACLNPRDCRHPQSRSNRDSECKGRGVVDSVSTMEPCSMPQAVSLRELGLKFS